MRLVDRAGLWEQARAGGAREAGARPLSHARGGDDGGPSAQPELLHEHPRGDARPPVSAEMILGHRALTSRVRVLDFGCQRSIPISRKVLEDSRGKNTAATCDDTFLFSFDFLGSGLGLRVSTVDSHI